MIEKAVKIQLETGLTPRPIAVLVQRASMFDSTVYIHTDGRKVNAKSIMGMMSLDLGNGETVTVAADGADEAAAVESIEAYLSGRE